jgi:hypothetical protein
MSDEPDYSVFTMNCDDEVVGTGYRVTGTAALVQFIDEALNREAVTYLTVHKTMAMFDVEVIKDDLASPRSGETVPSGQANPMKSTWFRVEAETREAAEQIAVDWATNYSQPEGAILDRWSPAGSQSRSAG